MNAVRAGAARHRVGDRDEVAGGGHELDVGGCEAADDTMLDGKSVTRGKDDSVVASLGVDVQVAKNDPVSGPGIDRNSVAAQDADARVHAEGRDNADGLGDDERSIAG